MQGRGTRVPGHVLIGNGHGHHIDYARGELVLNEKVGGPGRGVCSCGSFSPVLGSQRLRQVWMREDHKPNVIEEASKSGQ